MIMRLQAHLSAGVPVSRIIQYGPWAFVWSTLEIKVLSTVINVSHCQILLKMLCLVLKMIFFHLLKF